MEEEQVVAIEAGKSEEKVAPPGNGRAKKVVALSLALAIVGTVVAVTSSTSAGATEGDGESSVAPSIEFQAAAKFAPKENSYVEATHEVVQGKIALDANNVLEWSLSRLEREKEGMISIHEGSDCQDVGAIIGAPGSFNSLIWKSDDRGTASGSVDLDTLPGVRPVAANAGHLVVVHKTSGDFAACGILTPQVEFADFGIKAKLNDGFLNQEGLASGEIIVSNGRNITSAICNLEPETTGHLSFIQDDNCGEEGEVVFETTWTSNENGVFWKTIDDLSTTTVKFASLVGSSVALYNSTGDLAACSPLQSFVESSPVALESAREALSVFLGQA